MIRHARPRLAAFTIIELLLVMVILTVLAALIVPKFVGRSEQARVAAAHTDISNIEVALDAFEVDNGRFPTAQEGLQALLAAPPGMADWKGPYLKKGSPKDPWGNPYVYHYPGQHNTTGYDLYSFGPNAQEGGDDDIGNWTDK